jgi:hypothetical protein
MDTFQQALVDWLKDPTHTQAALAAAIGKTQVSVHRYRSGGRFPDAETARRIDSHTHGEVPFSSWHADFLARAGLNSSAPTPTERAA